MHTLLSQENFRSFCECRSSGFLLISSGNSFTPRLSTTARLTFGELFYSLFTHVTPFTSRCTLILLLFHFVFSFLFFINKCVSSNHTSSQIFVDSSARVLVDFIPHLVPSPVRWLRFFVPYQQIKSLRANWDVGELLYVVQLVQVYGTPLSDFCIRGANLK